MKRDIVTSIIGIIVFTVLLGLVYPLLITGISQVESSPGNANGQQIQRRRQARRLEADRPELLRRR
jgi:K+-transporting ATPase ATPase C chain